MSRKSKSVRALELFREQEKADLLKNAEKNVGNIIVINKELYMYYNPEKRYRRWTDIVGGFRLTNYWCEETEDYSNEENMLEKIAGFAGCDLGYYTEVDSYEKNENGNYRVIMNVGEGSYLFDPHKWDIILCEKGHILEKTKLNQDGTIDMNYNENDDDDDY